MKKLLTAMVAAAFAFGGFADGEPTWPQGTNFDSDTVGWTLTQLSDAAYWGAIELEADRSVEVAAYEQGERYSGQEGRPAIGPSTAADDQNYLAVNTSFTNGIVRKVNTDGTGVNIGDGFYFDSLVKLSACDDEKPTTASDDKIKLKIWVKETESTGATNIFVSAGYVNSNGSVTETDYDCGTFSGADEWQRITIKAFNVAQTGTKIGFVVFRNGNALHCNAAKGSNADNSWWKDADLNSWARIYNNQGELFPSMDQTTGDAAKVVSVSFAGKGAVDDLTFTDRAPEFATVGNVFSLAYDEHVTGFTYQLDTDTPVVRSNLTGGGVEDIVFMNTAAHTVTIANVTYAQGYKADTWTTSDNENVSLSGTTFSIVNGAVNCGGGIVSMSADEYVWIGENAYPTLARAFQALNAMAPDGNYTIQLDANATSAALTLGDGDGLITVEAYVTIDLNGQTITGNGTSGAVINSGLALSLTITDTSLAKNGCISAPANVKAVQCSATSEAYIEGGIFAGEVDLASAYQGKAGVTGGSFSYADNTDTGAFTLASYVAEGYEAATDSELDPQYWVVSEVQVTTWQVRFYDGESLVETTNVVDGTTAVAPETPVKLGYTFLGWFLPGAGQAFNFATPITQALDLTAKWEIQEWTITYYDDSEPAQQFATDTYNVTNRADKALNAGIRAGSTFDGWSDENGDACNSLEDRAGDLNLYGTWTPFVSPTVQVTVPSVSHTTVAIYTNDVAEAAYSAAGTYAVARGTNLAITYTAGKNYLIGGAASWTTNIVDIAADFTLNQADIPAVEENTVEEIEEAKAGDDINVAGKTVVIDNVNHTVTVDGVPATIKSYYVATKTGDTLTISLTTNEVLNGTKIEAKGDTPALSFDTEGNIVISLPDAKDLYYAIDYCDSPSFTGTVKTKPVTVSGGTVSAPMNSEGGRFYRMRVSDKPILVTP